MSFRGHRRFANQESPERERREIGFAGPASSGSNGGAAGSSGTPGGLPESTFDDYGTARNPSGESPVKPASFEEYGEAPRPSEGPRETIEHVRRGTGAKVDIAAELSVSDAAREIVDSPSNLTDFWHVITPHQQEKLSALLPLEAESEQTLDDGTKRMTSVPLRPGTKAQRAKSVAQGDGQQIDDIKNSVDIQHFNGGAIVGYLQQHLEKRQEFVNVVEQMLDNPYESIRFAKMQEQRLWAYENFTRIVEKRTGLVIGDVDLEKLQHFETEILNAQGRTLSTWLHGLETYQKTVGKPVTDWPLEESIPELDATIEMLREYFGIDPKLPVPEPPSALDKHGKPKKKSAAERIAGTLHKTWYKLKPGEGVIDADGRATRETLVRGIFNGVTAKHKLETMQKNDGGEDPVKPGFRRETVEKIRARILKIRTVTEKKIQDKAKELNQHYISKIWKPLCGKDTGEISRNLHISRWAIGRRLSEILEVLQRAMRENSERNLPEKDDPNFTEEAQSLLYALGDLEWMRGKNKRELYDGFLGEDRKNAEQARDYIVQNVDRMRDAVGKCRDPRRKDIAQSVQELLCNGNGVQADEMLRSIEKVIPIAKRFQFGDTDATSEDWDALYDWLSHTTQRNIEMFLGVTESVRFREQAQTDREAIQKNMRLDNGEAAAAKLRARLQEAKKTLFPGGSPDGVHEVLKHEICGPSKIPEKLWGFIAVTEKSIIAGTGSDNPVVRREFAAGAMNVEKIATCVKLLTTIRDRITEVQPENIATYARVARTTETPGCYSAGRNDNRIYLNMGKIEGNDHMERVIHHETGHAILNIVAVASGILPSLYTDQIHALQRRTIARTGDRPGVEQTALDVLMNRADDWHQSLQPIVNQERDILLRSGDTSIPIDRIAEERALELQREYLTDELLAQEASWVKSGRSEPKNPEDAALFSTLGEIRKEQARAQSGDESESMGRVTSDKLGDLPERVAVSHAAGEAGEFGDEGGDEDGGAKIELQADVNQEIRTMKNVKLQALKTFINSFPNHPQHGELEALYTWASNALETEIVDPYNEDLSDDEAMARMNALKGRVNPIVEELQKITAQQMDVTDVPRAGKGLYGIFSTFELVSLSDLWKTVQSAGEDLQRMWKRRGERAQSELGGWLTKWIPDNTLWGLSYAGQLKHEFERRSNASELDEVKQWKDALGNVDSYRLLDLLEGSRNRDQVRAIIELLVEKGRMDWDRQGIWETLNFLSNYSMPTVACRNNDILRDKWLQKLITDIWDDKDKFNEWRRGNDHAYESEMEKFTDTTDQLSNVAGGLSGELKRQLTVWKHCRQNGLPIPESVNPHYYEKVLKYSIENGKMTMEQKFFYLIQGIRFELLSIDRVRVLAGEKGGVLLQFPYIDYFYQKNNSAAEIEALGERLEEGDDPNAPGPKTSLFLHLEVTREESVRQRIAKAQDRVAESIDHEDIPLLVSQIDYSQLTNLADVISGSRFKVTREGWKNAYVGFNTKFKAFARLAQMDEEGRANLSSRDAELFAQSVVAMMHMDNILTKNGGDKTKRPELSWSEFQTPSPSSGSIVKVITYRRAAMNFTKDLIDELEGAGVYNFAREVGVARGEYFKQEGDPTLKGEDQQRKVFDATRKFNSSLSKVLRDNPQILMNVLRRHADDFWEEGRLAEGDQEISLENTRQYMESMRHAHSAHSAHH